MTLSTDEPLCKTAAEKFVANVPAQSLIPPSGKVYVFLVGPTHYFVVDPDYRVSAHLAYEMLFTTNWVLVTQLGH